MALPPVAAVIWDALTVMPGLVLEALLPSVEFVTVMLWDSLEALRCFAGNDYEQAIVPVERRKLLSHYDERSAHYEILMHPATGDVSSSA